VQKDRSEVKKALESKGFKLSDKKSKDHFFYIYIYKGKKTSIFTKLSHGSKYKSIGDDLLQKMSRQLKLNKVQFIDFVDCPLTKEDYEKHLKDIGVI
jgi:hypothetical protein